MLGTLAGALWSSMRVVLIRLRKDITWHQNLAGCEVSK
jgi:hypothetical protein